MNLSPASGSHPVDQHSAAPVVPHSEHPLRGYLYIAAATFCWGVAAAGAAAVFTGRWLPGSGVHAIDPLVLSQTRVSFSFLILAPALWLARTGSPARAGIARGGVSNRADRPLHSSVPMTKADFGRALLIGTAGISASNYFYYVAIQKTNVTTAIVLQYLAPVWVLVYMVARKLQRATPPRVLGVALAVAGSALAVGAFRSSAVKFNTAGVAAGLAASVGFAIYNVGGSVLLRRYDRLRVFLYAMLGATIFWAVVNPPWKLVQAHFSGAQWIFLVSFAIASILVPYTFYFSGLRHLDATRAIVTSSLEPVFAIAMAALLVAERVTPVQMVGVALVLAATVIVQQR
jgi:drug/metabolite transporter (DMT)-like permease